MLKYKEMISQATSYTTKLLRKRFGKGPESVHISLSDRCIIFHLRNFISPVEDFLLNQQEEETFRYTRELIMKSMLPEMKEFLQNELGLEVTEMYYDWGMHNASGVIVGMLHSSQSAAEEYEGKQQIHQQIIDLTEKIQKKPEVIDSWWVNPKTLFVYRKGIVILIERELSELGQGNILKTAKRRLEKRLLEQEVHLEGLLNKQVLDIYVDWDFKTDQSMLVYIFE